MQTWDYCMLKGCTTNEEGFCTEAPRLIFFRRKGLSVVALDRKTIHRTYGFESAGDYVANVIALLGEEGWEMVSAVPVAGQPGNHALYFKRPHAGG